MCGIAAIFSYADFSKPIQSDELVKMRDSMQVRGPDGFGIWISDRRHVGLAHRRLSIIDLSDSGIQPMSLENDRLKIVFNGEIYNYQTLRRDLEAKGHHFQTSSDTEVLLHLYSEKGVRMVDELRGMFAFAIWDNEKQGLFVVRDPFGVKPLYFHNDGNVFRCASQVKALLQGGGIYAQAEPAGHVGFFLWGSVPEPYTLYKDVFSLPSGSWLWVDRNGVRAPHKYFSVADELERAAFVDPGGQKAEDILKLSIEDSIRHHLISDVPVGVFLSSGVDSSVITAISSGFIPGIQAITLGFQEYANTYRDEVPLAEKTSAHYGCIHQVARITRKDFEDEYERIVLSMDQPTVDGVNTYFVARAASQAGLKVVLSGLGGDELFAGYPGYRHIPAMVSLLSPFAKVPGLGKGFRTLTSSMFGTLTSPKYAGLFELGGSYGGAYLLRRGLFMPWELSGFLDIDLVKNGWETLQPVLRLDDLVRPLRTPRAKVSAIELSQYMRNVLLRDSDWAGMAHSLEIRVPLVDVELFRAVAPFIARNSLAVTKQNMAVLPEKPLPADVVNRKKTGFSIPVQEWINELGSRTQGLRGLRGWAKRVYETFDFGNLSSHKSQKRIFSLVTDAFGSNGGMSKFNRDFLTSLSNSTAISQVVAVPRMAEQQNAKNELPIKLYYDLSGIGGKVQYFSEIIRVIRKHRRFDLVFCGHINLLPLAYLVARFYGAPLWCAIHGVEAWQKHKNPVVNWVACRLDGFVAVSDFTRQRFQKWSNVSDKRSFILPNSYDPALYSPGGKSPELIERLGIQGKKVLLTVARLSAVERYKGVDEVLEVLPSLLAEIPDIVYLVVGAGNDMNRLKTKAVELGIQEKVVFTGYISDEEKQDVFRLADVYVMPGYGEGFGIVYLEAMASGIPVIGSKLDGSREALRDGKLGILVNPRDPVEIKSGIIDALKKPNNKDIPSGLDYFSLKMFNHRSSQLLDTIFQDVDGNVRVDL